MEELLQPHLTMVIQSLIAVIATMIVAALVELRRKVLTWIERRTTIEQRALLHQIAVEAFSFAEKVYVKSGGNEKYRGAYIYMSDRLQRMNIRITDAEIRALIEQVVIASKKPS